MISNADGEPLAIILAAGVGKRLSSVHVKPKVLLDFGGQTLLERHLDALEGAGVSDIRVTVGHQADQLRSALGARATAIDNPDFRKGSLVSLWAARAALRSGHPVLLMDGDVLYDKRMIEALLAAQGEAVLLVDREIEPGDEPVKVCFRGKRMVDFRKRPEHAHDWHGESVGFFKFSPGVAARLADLCDDYVHTGRTDVEYEEAIRDLILQEPDLFTHVDVTSLPWTEIDFPEDVDRARAAILPALQS